MISGPDDIARAAAALRSGGLVIAPTETVYGLAADAANPQAVAALYQAKGRPAFNPLIAHVADAAGARRIATLGIGYADGYRRALSNRGVVLLNGSRARVAGIVTMDMTMIDVTDVACAVGDVATLIGRDGADVLTVDEVANTAEVLSYELLVGLKLRAPRVYADDEPRT